MPTFERGPRFDREFRRLSRELQRAFLAALPMFIEALRAKPPAFPPALRVKRVEGAPGVWELSFAPDGRATFARRIMIVLGADTHKRSHTIAAIATGTGEQLGEQTAPVGRRGFGTLLQWARSVDDERVWALEDCRHVSGSLERFLIERGERVLRNPTHLSAKARKSARQRGKSDPIDAIGESGRTGIGRNDGA